MHAHSLRRVTRGVSSGVSRLDHPGSRTTPVKKAYRLDNPGDPMGIREYSLAIAVGTPSVGVPVVLGIYLYHGFSCAYVCETALHWQKAWTSARGVRTLARDGARAVRLRQRPPPAVRPS